MTFKAGKDAKGGFVRDANVKAGLRLAVLHLLNESNDRVPHDTGDLERSGKTSVDVGTRTAAVSYNTPYAVVQHEDFSLNHPNGGQAKFLETAMYTEADTIAQIIAVQLRKGAS